MISSIFDSSVLPELLTYDCRITNIFFPVKKKQKSDLGTHRLIDYSDICCVKEFRTRKSLLKTRNNDEWERKMKHNFTITRLCQNNLMVLLHSCCIFEKCGIFFPFLTTSLVFGVRFLVEKEKCL